MTCVLEQRLVDDDSASWELPDDPLCTSEGRFGFKVGIANERAIKVRRGGLDHDGEIETRSCISPAAVDRDQPGRITAMEFWALKRWSLTLRAWSLSGNFVKTWCEDQVKIGNCGGVWKCRWSQAQLHSHLSKRVQALQFSEAMKRTVTSTCRS